MSEVDLERSVDDNNPPPDGEEFDGKDSAPGFRFDATNVNGFDVPSGIFGLN